MMKHPLKIYREKNSISQDGFASLLNISEASVSRIESGLQKPSLDLAYSIEQATKGKVTASQLAKFAAERVLP